MELSEVEKTRKRRLAYTSIIFSFLLILGFSIVDYWEGDMVEMWMDLLIGALLIVSGLCIYRFNADFMIYRFFLGLLSACFLSLVVIGAGSGTVVFWLFPFPIVFMFFLGRREGGVFAAVFLFCLSILLFSPFSFHKFDYPLDSSIRFFASLLFTTFITYIMQASIEKYGHLSAEKHRELLAEKENLEKAMRENKTLNGLLPICCHCKKIRDDQGYWQQVEVYVRDRSGADFSHSICPDCFKILYPDYRQIVDPTAIPAGMPTPDQG
jgi:hypothetical protein